jgi:hypothetical protein
MVRAWIQALAIAVHDEFAILNAYSAMCHRDMRWVACRVTALPRPACHF